MIDFTTDKCEKMEKVQIEIMVILDLRFVRFEY